MTTKTYVIKKMEILLAIEKYIESILTNKKKPYTIHNIELSNEDIIATANITIDENKK